MDNMNNLNEDELNEVVGGNWQANKRIISDARQYSIAGVTANYTSAANPMNDTFSYKGESISEETAAAIVFYFNARLNSGAFEGIESELNSFSKLDAIKFKYDHTEEYTKFINGLR